MTRSYMAVCLTPSQTKELNLPEDYEYVRSAFYMGLPYMEVMNRVRLDCFAEERKSVIETAKLLGTSDDDRVYYTTLKRVE